MDGSQHYMLPGDLLVFNLEEGLKHPKQLPDEQAERLVRTTTEAISRRLKQPA